MARALFSVCLLAVCRLAPAHSADSAANELESLSVGDPHTLQPAFDPQRRRYWVRALPNESSTLLLQATAAFGSAVRVDRSPISGETSVQIVSEMQSILIDVGTDDEDTRGLYEVLVVPDDFPEFVLEFLDEEEVARGFLYLEPSRGNGSHLLVTDDHGFPFAAIETEDKATNFQLHPSGEITYAEVSGGNEFERVDHEIVFLDGQFRETDRRQTIGLNNTERHEFRSFPGDRHLFLAYHGTVRDISCCGGNGLGLVEDAVIQEVDASTETLLSEWSSWGHLEPVQPLASRPEYAHVNSLDLDAEGNVLLSASFLSQIALVDRDTGEVAWKLGGVDNEFDIEDPRGQFCAQHYVRWIAENRIMIFDNGWNCPLGTPSTEISRAIEYEIDVESRTARLVWSYKQDDLFATSRGSAQRLDNGNTLIGWGDAPGITATEVTPSGRKAFQFTLSWQGTTSLNYRLERFDDQIFWDGFETSDVHRWDAARGFDSSSTPAGSADPSSHPELHP